MVEQLFNQGAVNQLLIMKENNFSWLPERYNQNTLEDILMSISLFLDLNYSRKCSISSVPTESVALLCQLIALLMIAEQGTCGSDCSIPENYRIAL